MTGLIVCISLPGASIAEVVRFRGIGLDPIYNAMRGGRMVPFVSRPARVSEIRRANAVLMAGGAEHPAEDCCHGNGHYWDQAARMQRLCPCGASEVAA